MMNTSGLKSLFAFCTIGAVIVFSAFTAYGQDIALNSDSPSVYVVKDGDTLWDISATFLQEPWRWPEIWQVNPDIVDPDLIYPGDMLTLIYVDGSPRIRMERGNRPTVKLSPQVREMPLLSPIPAIPRQALSGFLVSNRIVDQAEFESAPYILASASGNLIMGAGHEVYARGGWNGAMNNYEVFRLGPTYTDPLTEEVLGQEAINLGSVSIVSDEGVDVRKALIVSSNEELKAGDRLLQREISPIDQSFFPVSPSVSLDGRVIGLLNNESQASQFETVVVGVGSSDGLKVGDVLAIFQDGDAIKDPITHETVVLPESEIGLLMTYRTFENLSYGVILSLTQPTRVGNTVRTP